MKPTTPTSASPTTLIPITTPELNETSRPSWSVERAACVVRTAARVAVCIPK